jgi:Holliday junction resolvase RusA-like endonuclease
VILVIPGIPVPQGSKNPWGGEANKNTKPWRATVAAAAVDGMNGSPLLTGPVAVEAVFCFPRPKSHYRTGRRATELRESAPTYHSGPPDLDKLQRAIGDALEGSVLRNDGQIAKWTTRKLYAEPARCELHIHSLNQHASEGAA